MTIIETAKIDLNCMYFFFIYIYRYLSILKLSVACVCCLDNLVVFIIIIGYLEAIIDDTDGVYGNKDGGLFIGLCGAVFNIDI